jgi:hypothetical protein
MVSLLCLLSRAEQGSYFCEFQGSIFAFSLMTLARFTDRILKSLVFNCFLRSALVAGRRTFSH